MRGGQGTFLGQLFKEGFGDELVQCLLRFHNQAGGQGQPEEINLTDRDDLEGEATNGDCWRPGLSDRKRLKGA